MAAKKKQKPDKLSKKGQVQISGEALPRRSLEQVVRIAETLYTTYAGKSASWEELCKTLDLTPQNANTKYLIWSALSYGIIKREETKEYSLSEIGRKIVAAEYDSETLEGIRKAILTPTVLSKFYTDYNGHPIPSSVHLPNVLENRFGVPRDRVEEATKIIFDNARFAKILEEPKEPGQPPILRLPGVASAAQPASLDNGNAASSGGEFVPESATPSDVTEWDKILFYITPIGDEATEVRKHADMMLKHLLEPVSKQFHLKIVRADKIDRAGIITQQIFEHLAKARLCIADLSFSNPNAFYELGVRHVCKLSTIQVIRKGDKIPFDVSQGRTITIDTSDVYTVMDRMDSARRELAEYVKNAMASNHGDSADDNPVNVYLPGLKVTIPK